jgi:teichuronic acid biosynthesis glycosyltransferase TuaC
VKVLAVSNLFPKEGAEFAGIFVRREILALRELGVDVEEFETSYRKDPRANWNAFRKRLSVSRPDLINVYFGSVGAFAASLGSPVPLVLTFGGSDLLGAARRDPLSEQLACMLAATLSQTAAPNADAIVVRSEQLRHALLRGSDRARTHVVPAGVDTSVFRPLDKTEARRELGWDPAATIVLFGASRHRPIKRFDRALAAVDRLGQHGISARLESLERVPPGRMPIYLNAADCMLLTSQHEGSPNVVKEAVACGCPVVAVPVGDVAEILRDVSPSRVADADPESLALALQAVLGERRRSNGPERILRGYSLSFTAGRLHQIYEDTVRAWHSGRRHGWRAWQR